MLRFMDGYIQGDSRREERRPPPGGGEAVRQQNVTGRQYWKSIIDRPGDCEAGIWTEGDG